MPSRLILPSMAGAFLVYILFHSPLRGLLASLAGSSSHQCFFACNPDLSVRGVSTMVSAALLIAAAGWAARRLAAAMNLGRAEAALAWALLWAALIVVPSAWLGAAASMVGVPLLRPPLGPLLASAPAVFLALRVRDWQLTSGVRGPLSRTTPLLLVLGAAAAALLSVSLAVALAHPPDGYDALSYHGPVAVYLWRGGDLDSWLRREPGAWALAHPASAELWFGLLRLFGGERLANLGQLPFALLGGVAVGALARRTGAGPGGARLAALAFLLAPIVALQSGIQVNDLAAGVLLMVAAALVVADPPEWTAGRALLCGLALGLAITTKLALLPAAGAVWLFLCLRLPRPVRLRMLSVAALGFVIVVLPWWGRNLALYGNPIYPAALPLLGRGYVVGDFIKKDRWFVPGAKAWPLYPLVELHSDVSGFGALFAVGAIPGLLAAWKLSRRAPFLLYLLILGMSIPAWWILTQHEPRLLLGVFGMGFAFLPWALAGMPRRFRWLGAATLAAAGLFSAAVTLDQIVRSRMSQPTDRGEFYEVAWGIDSTVAALPEGEGLLDHTSFAPLSYAADYALLGPRQTRNIATIDGAVPTDSIVALMRRLDLRYAYIPFTADSAVVATAMYADPRFALVHSSVVGRGPSEGARRRLYRLTTPMNSQPAPGSP